MRTVFAMTAAAALLALAACQSVPIEAQLATACNSIAAGYRTAAAYRAQGKLSADTIQTLTSLEPHVQAICDPAHPPADLPTALAKADAYLNQIALVNAGVK